MDCPALTGMFTPEVTETTEMDPQAADAPQISRSALRSEGNIHAQSAVTVMAP